MTKIVKDGPTPEITELLARLIREGNYPHVACMRAGISHSTFSKWMKRGEGRALDFSPTEEYLSFASAVREAEAECEAKLVKTVVEAAGEDAEIALKFLSRRFPDRWGEKRLNVNANIDWRIRAIQLVQSGELTLLDVEHELGAELASEVRAMLEERAPSLAASPDVVEGEVVETPVSNDSKSRRPARRSNSG